MLNEIPMIYGSYPKETLYFESGYWRGAEWYRKACYPSAEPEFITMEGRPNIAHLPFALKRLYADSPDCKIIYCVRDPIDQVISHWHHFYSMRPGRELEFADAIDREFRAWHPNRFTMESEVTTNCDARGGMYHIPYLEAASFGTNAARIVELFGRNNLMIVLTNSIYAQGTWDRMSKFLDIDVTDVVARRENIGSGAIIDYIKENEKETVHRLELFLLGELKLCTNIISMFRGGESWPSL